ncbi:uncharacterized protein FOMMEDRAFT_148701 [Fomitiporia mediterranea MF3/22]|uniref:uncharacterized protein n=1 Tax=Fomitiporia mediterranea (strain MF3/22) TaxID=694068 RepID=UPI0004408069|nr:uncharacterized protein FOMMEDRAFT_148701 [Fomitiporia mediterranea MF3/22]EJC99548.1 hypothetical protein FOMMEDRAFT_148701 [Fomitiporia mediterranea MF3/22]
MFSIFKTALSFWFQQDVGSPEEELDEIEEQCCNTLPGAWRTSSQLNTPKPHRKQTRHVRFNFALPIEMSPKQKRRLQMKQMIDRKKARVQAQKDGERLYEMHYGESTDPEIGKKEFRFKKPVNDLPPSPKCPSLVVSDSKSYRETGNNLRVSEVASNYEVESTCSLLSSPPLRRYSYGPDLLPAYLHSAFLWFHLVRNVVVKKSRSEYKLEYSCTPRAILYMVFHGWIDLADAVSWKNSRHMLGLALADLASRIGGFEKLEDEITEKPDNAALATFLKGWPLSRGPKKGYNWISDRRDRAKYGPFGPLLARYATPEVQEMILQTLLTSDTPLDKVNFPGNWKPFFLPLVLRKRQRVQEAKKEKVERVRVNEENRRPQEIPATYKRQRVPDVHVQTMTKADYKQDSHSPQYFKEVQERVILEAPKYEDESISCHIRAKKPLSRSYSSEDKMSGVIDLGVCTAESPAFHQPWTAEGPSQMATDIPIQSTNGIVAGQGWKPTGDVNMDEPVLIVSGPSGFCVPSGAGQMNDMDCSMAVEFTDPAQSVDSQAGDRRPFTSPAGPSGVQQNGSWMKYAEKRVKHDDIPQPQAQNQLQPQAQSQLPPQRQPTLEPQLQSQPPLQFQLPPQLQPQSQPPVPASSTPSSSAAATPAPSSSTAAPRRGARATDRDRGGSQQHRRRQQNRHAAQNNNGITGGTVNFDPILLSLVNIPLPNFAQVQTQTQTQMQN